MSQFGMIVCIHSLYVMMRGDILQQVTINTKSITKYRGLHKSRNLMKMIHQKGMHLDHGFYVDVEKNVVQKMRTTGHQHNYSLYIN